MTTDAKRVRILRPTSKDAFPAIALEEAAPCLLEDDDLVLVPDDVDAAGARRWAELLAPKLEGRYWGVRKLADSPRWTHWLRLLTEDGVYRDFVVVAHGLPADEFEELAQGLESAELEVSIGPGPVAGKLN